MRIVTEIVRSIKKKLRKDPDSFLNEIAGVIHVGANTGQEREVYKNYNLDVLWIEPIPEVFQVLKSNLEGFPRQKAYQYLITDKDNEEYEFHVANNFGESSSIFDLNLHKDIWPQVNYERSITLKSITLSSLVDKENIDTRRYDALVMDTQGSELLVLKGAERMLGQFKYIKTEVPDFESYAGCCQVNDIERFVGVHGFKEYSTHRVASREGVGSYYDIVYENERSET